MRDQPTGGSTLGARLKFWRQERGFRLADLRDLSGVSLTYLSDLERGTLTNPTLQTLDSIAQALEVSVSDLLSAGGESASAPRYGGALEDLRVHPQFQDAIIADAARFRVTPLELEEAWLRTLAGIRVMNTSPKSALDYLFIFEAIKRSLSPS